ncbi:monosaccharide ABC transporter ATP-binding protein, CUT2 family [Ruaniaceae bacterium KH17]|nr:monosaccharide ABC transporter ATP-binding protein, CUT2 family [Ruaniaceae bacterium KH17]
MSEELPTVRETAASLATDDYAIETHDIGMSFSGVRALDNVNLSIRRREIHAIVGENGAGKSTLMKILSGQYLPTNGRLLINGEEAKISGPQDASETYGIGIINQEFSLVPYLNAYENIYLGRELQKAGLSSRKAMATRARELLAQLDAEIDVKIPVNHLSVAEQQLIEIAKATVDKKDILIFDEPTAALTGNEVDSLFKLIFRLRDEGTTILYISHHLDEIYTLSDRFSVLRDGQYIGTRDTSTTSQGEMIKMMVGREVIAEFPPRVTPIDADPFLVVNDLTTSKISAVKFELRPGEIIGFAGVVGSGRTEIIRALIGADKTIVQDVELDGKSVKIDSPKTATKLGFGLIPEDRKRQGLILGMSVKENSTISVVRELTSFFGLIKGKLERGMVEKSVADLRTKAPTINQKVKNLSGGNQQKVVLAKWLNTGARVLIFDEPTRGIDIGARDEIYRLIRQLSESGTSIIIVSSDLPEVLGLSDRVYVVYNGRIAAELAGAEIDAENVMLHATGGTSHVND